jgi:hypothetical protein
VRNEKAGASNVKAKARSELPMNAIMSQATLMVSQIASVHALLGVNDFATPMEQPGLVVGADAGAGAGTGVNFSVF